MTLHCDDRGAALLARTARDVNNPVEAPYRKRERALPIGAPSWWKAHLVLAQLAITVPTPRVQLPRDAVLQLESYGDARRLQEQLSTWTW